MVMLLSLEQSRCTCWTWSKATKRWPKREFSRNQEQEREREGKTEGNSRSSFRVFIVPRIRVHTYTAPYWRRCGAYCFYWCFYGGWHAPITISAAKPKPIAPIYVQVKPSSDLFQAGAYIY